MPSISDQTVTSPSGPVAARNAPSVDQAMSYASGRLAKLCAHSSLGTPTGRSQAASRWLSPRRSLLIMTSHVAPDSLATVNIHSLTYDAQC